MDYQLLLTGIVLLLSGTNIMGEAAITVSGAG
jgi:hypothetical protein